MSHNDLPKPHDSWVLKDDGNGILYWDSPIEMPKDGKVYFWHEESLSWKEMT
jgi:hypothetical protein